MDNCITMIKYQGLGNDYLVLDPNKNRVQLQGKKIALLCQRGFGLGADGILNDFTVELLVEDFIDTVQNEKLAVGLRHLTDRQRRAIELAFWEGYQYKEIAAVFQCNPAAVTLLLQRAFHRFLEYLNIFFAMHIL